MKRSRTANLITGPASRPLREWVRRYLLRLWESRGGGFYGFVAALMFLYLEIIDISRDLVGIGGFRVDLGWLIGFLAGNFVDAVVNTVHAAIWPVTWMGQFGLGLWSGLLLGIAYASYRAMRPSVLRLLRGRDEHDAVDALMGAADSLLATGGAPRPR